MTNGLNIEQEETFIINDINMEINPSDINVMDDNWVIEESYLRSKAVFCYRSSYATTKVVLNIPFQISHLTDEEQATLNNTYNCVKLISQLNSYPFCFIKNNRIRNYISPTAISATGYMIFAVDEIAIVQDANASNMVFLEVVLQYFNHVPLIADFNFRSNLSADLTQFVQVEDGDAAKDVKATKSNYTVVKDLPPDIVDSLEESAVWKRYMDPKVKEIFDNMADQGLLAMHDVDTAKVHTMMGVKLLAPIMSEINKGYENADDGKLVGPNTRVITTSDTSGYDNGAFENMLNTMLDQDFTGDAKYEQNKENPQTYNSEKYVKDGKLTSKDSRDELKPDIILTRPDTNADGTVNNPFMSTAEPLIFRTETIKYEDKVNSLKEAQNNNTYDKIDAARKGEPDPGNTRDPNLGMGSKDIFIQWSGKDLASLQMGIQTIQIRKKNRLASHQISSFKHPIIQYMGQYPVEVSLTMASVNFDIYKTDEYTSNTFIKQVLNILDYNRTIHPEAEAYNYIEIKSLATILMGVTSYLPSQSAISASASSQGLESIQYTFNESNLTSFIEETTVEASGKLSISKGNVKINKSIIEWLGKFPPMLTEILSGKSSLDNTVITNNLEIYKLCMELAKEGARELGLDQYNHVKGIDLGISYAGDLKPNNNITREFTRIDTSTPKQLSKYVLYDVYEPNRTKQDDPVYGGFNWAVMNVGSAAVANKDKPKVEKPKGTKVNTASLHYGLIPFLIKVIELRTVLTAGGSSDIANLSFRPGGKYNNLVMNILAKMEASLKANDPTVSSIFDTKEEKELFEQLTETYANSFTGYNLDDLELERLSPIKYDKATDLLIPEIDPFFFLVEKYNLTGNELFEVYDNLYAKQGDSQELITAMNKEDNEAKDEADSTATALGVTYRKLQEIEYKEPLVSNVDYSRYAGVMSGGRTAATKAEQDDMIIRMFKILTAKGFSKNQAQIFLAEIGRENSFNPDVIFGYHNDPRRGYNVGMISWQNSRFTALVNILKSRGLIKGSTIERSDACIAAQIDYVIQEIRTDSSYSPTKNIFWDNKNVSYSQGSRVLGTNYIRWRYTDAAYSSGHANRDAFYKRVVELTKNLGAAVDKNGNSTVQFVKDAANSYMNNPQVQRLLGTKPTNPKVGIGVLKNQQAVVKNISKEYSGVKKSSADKTNTITIGKTSTGRVVSVTDGDTFSFFDKTTGKTYSIRMYGLDAPEVAHGFSTEGEEIEGANARTALQQLIGGKDVTIQANGTDRDRTIARVILSDGTDVSLTMLRNGYGFVPAGLTSAGAYNKAQEDAKAAQRGVWSYPPGVVTPPRSKNQVKLEDKNAAAIKNNINYQTFSQNDLSNASKANGTPLNTYQPFLGGQTFKISSPFGMRKHPIHKDYRLHKGVDFACPSGTKVVAAAPGQVKVKTNPGGYGNYIEIDHGNGFVSLYAHLSKFLVANNAYVQTGAVIALSGNTGASSGAHLHYGVRYNNNFINPFGTKPLSQYKPGDSVGVGINTTVPMDPLSDDFPNLVRDRSGVNDYNTVFNEDELAREIFKRMYKYTNIGMKASLPCIKVYVTIGNENDKFWLDTLKGGVQYYEVKGIKNFHMNCNNDGNPMDTVIMTVADPSFLNTDSFTGLSKMQGINYDKIGTDLETQFVNDRLQMKVGTKLHIRAGYGNNPNNLEVIFNGKIDSVDNSTPQALRLVCSSYSAELLSELLAPNKPVFLNDQGDNISTSSIIGECLVSRNIEHMGYNSGFWADKIRGSSDPEDRSLAPGKLSFSYSFGYDFTKASYKSRLFMNVFAPEIEKLDDEFNSYNGWVSNLLALFSNHKGGYPFAVYKMTPWDCIKQMEYRHPNTIAKPIMYEDRMSLFYGIKEQAMFTKDLSKYVQMNAASEKESMKGSGISTVTYAERRRERMSPAVGVHLVTSSHNLISNGISLNRNYSTVTNVNYYVGENAETIAKPWEMELMKMQFDDNLYPFELREKELTLSGCIGRYSSFLYGTTDLKKEAEKMYAGKIVILGNPSIKAGDYIFIDDTEKKMHGMLLIRECYHHFDDKNGMITEIVPGQYVEAANFMYSSLWLRLMCCSKIATSKLKNVLGSNFSAEDFNMVTDYLTIMNQVEIALDKYDKRDTDVAVGYNVAVGAVTTLSLILMHSLYSTLGAKNSAWRLGTGIYRFNKHFFNIYTHQIDKAVLSIAKTAGLSYISDKTKNVRGKLTAAKGVIGSSEFGEWWKNSKINKMRTGLAFRSTTGVLKFGAKATLTAAKVITRTMASAILALTFSNPITVLLDILAMYAVQWAFNKMEEIKLTRQPLLFFPLIKHGKAYTGGMAGIMRNSWGASKMLEASRTVDQIRKSAEIVSTNAEVQGRDSVLNTILKNIAYDYSADKKSMPLYETDAQGRQLVVDKNKVTNKEQLDYTKKQEEERKKLLTRNQVDSKIVNKVLTDKGY